MDTHNKEWCSRFISVPDYMLRSYNRQIKVHKVIGMDYGCPSADNSVRRFSNTA